MEKNFNKWNNQKKHIHNNRNTDFLYVKEREIWWCSLGANVGFEQDGKGKWFERPVVILKKFSRHLIWAIPLSTKNKTNLYYIECPSSDNIFRMAIISQMRILDTRRLGEKVGIIEKVVFNKIKKAVIDIINPPPF